MKQVWKFLTSLRLTVVLLAFAIVLVFVGTIAQADEGLYNAQARYFKHWFVFGIRFFGHSLPIPLPGGYLLGTLLLINLVAAHIQRFEWAWKKAGIHLTHAGIILLLVGQLVTDIFSKETQLRFFEGQTRNYSESGRQYELAITSDAGDGTQNTVAIPERLLTHGGEIKNDPLPFTLQVKQFWVNSEPSFRAPMQQNAPPITTNGLAQHFDFRQASAVNTMDEKNIPTATIEIVGANGSLGTWVVSGWAGDDVMVSVLRRSFSRQMGRQMTGSIMEKLTTPQTVTAGGKEFEFTLRPERVYHPFSLTLLKTTHTTYPGRPDIPKDFRSRIIVDNPGKQEKREVEIYMNEPLRYGGLTFYQYQMGADEWAASSRELPFSTLQVVRNPGWLTPYAGCVLVALGLTAQFMMHLVAFIAKRKRS